MTRFLADDSPPSRMRIARNAAELVLFGIREIPTAFNREGVAMAIRQAIASIYRAIDAGADSLVQPEALGQAATFLGAAREMLLSSAGRRTFQIDRAAGVLADARTHAMAACEAVAFDQMNRRMELPWGRAEESTPGVPFRASIGKPQLFALPRGAVEPFVDLGQAEPEPEPEQKVALAAPPTSIAELRAMAEGLFAAVNDAQVDEPQAHESDPTPNESEEAAPLNAESAAEAEHLMVAEIARDAIEDIASLGSLRHPIETESWLDQAPFEQRLLNRLDHFCSFGQDALRAAVLYHAESESPDEARAFALAFALGCIRGVDTVDAVVTTIRQSPPETFPGFVEGLVFATNPNVDDAMRILLGNNDLKLVGLAVDVLSQRRALLNEDFQFMADLGDPHIAWLAAKALGTNLDREQALEWLERIYATAESGTELHLAALESGLRRCHPDARRELRHLLEKPNADPQTARAAALLGLSGSARDLELLLSAVQLRTAPLALEGLGRFGHVHSMPALLQIIGEKDEVWSPAAARELERITGAGLFDEVEEPWVTELPPEAADMDVAIPMKKVRRVTTDPERWHDWKRQQGDAMDPMKKYRKGAPFVPFQLLRELEALEPRSDERERSALELSIATGQEFGFRSNDWVAEQQRTLAAMRNYLEQHAFEAGAWCFAGASVAARPEPRPAPAASVSKKPVVVPSEQDSDAVARMRVPRLPWEANDPIAPQARVLPPVAPEAQPVTPPPIVAEARPVTPPPMVPPPAVAAPMPIMPPMVPPPAVAAPMPIMPPMAAQGNVAMPQPFAEVRPVTPPAMVPPPAVAAPLPNMPPMVAQGNVAMPPPLAEVRPVTPPPVPPEARPVTPPPMASKTAPVTPPPVAAAQGAHVSPPAIAPQQAWVGHTQPVEQQSDSRGSWAVDARPVTRDKIPSSRAASAREPIARKPVPPPLPRSDESAERERRISSSPPHTTPTPPPKAPGVVPDFLYEAHFAEPPAKPIRFLSPGTQVSSGSNAQASRPKPPVEPPRVEEAPRAVPPPLPKSIEPPRVTPEAVDKKPFVPPPTYFDPNALGAADPKNPLKKLPWEK